jgi:hypothetical protein
MTSAYLSALSLEPVRLLAGFKKERGSYYLERQVLSPPRGTLHPSLSRGGPLLGAVHFWSTCRGHCRNRVPQNDEIPSHGSTARRCGPHGRIQGLDRLAAAHLPLLGHARFPVAPAIRDGQVGITSLDSTTVSSSPSPRWPTGDPAVHKRGQHSGARSPAAHSRRYSR